MARPKGGPAKSFLNATISSRLVCPLGKTNTSKMHDELKPKPKAKRAKIPKMESFFK